MDHHNHQISRSTPWNYRLTYAIDWSIVLGVPIVLLTVRNLGLLITKVVADRRQRGYHSVVGDEKEAEDNEERHIRPQGVDIPTRARPLTSTSAILSKQWSSYSRIENWAVNKTSATLYLGPYVHLVAGATLLALIYLAVLALLLLIKADLLLNSNRAGYLGLSCIPFLFAFTGKNSIVTYMTGLSHHRINQVHRFLGLCLFILSSVHMGCMFYVWGPWKFLLEQQLSTPRVRYGIATYTTLCLIVLTAAWPVRRWAYEAFVVSHTLFLVFIVLVGIHTPYAMRFTAAGIIAYMINVLTGWCVKTRTAFAQATVFQDRLTRLRMDKPVSHAPGQHIYVCVPSISLIQWHPFTISSVDQNSITVHARAVGGFTKRLCRWPENSQKRVVLAGPYGEGVRVGRESDSHKVIFVAAGSGFAYIVPILMDLLQNRRLQSENCIPIEIVWCVRDPDEVQWFQEELEVALYAAQGYLDSVEKDRDVNTTIIPDGRETQFRLQIHYTSLSFGDQEESIVVPEVSAPVPPPPESSVTSATTAFSTAAKIVPPDAPFASDNRVEWIGSRLEVPRYIKKKIEETPRDRVVEIVGCGPPLMLAELHNAVAMNESLSGCRVKLHTERFYM
ncbi:hypothetical protein BGZ65_008961 [Modicella reniformis]|uniref:ferric-chelate reductase (NADPH) n=1 Tax=Modicella reniformis TaxID=1440133 RepID=A0A9P6IN34_9FUNG|nr:hypothetical protein BGZ65_008961 [Modicella reniformis]